MQNRVRPFRVLLQDLDSFGGRQYLELDFTAMSLAVHLFHHQQRSGPGADHKSPTLPRYLLFNRERCMPKPVTEPSQTLNGFGPKLGFTFGTVEKVKNGELTAEDIIVKLSKRKSRA